jgi:hypothetical protein
MSPEQTPEVEKREPETQEAPQETHKSHTYEDDLSLAMNATDASVVQELLTEAREREVTEKEYRIKTVQRKWYSFFSVFFVLLAVFAFGYGIYHYQKLTVPVEKSLSVGVFPSTNIVVTSSSSIESTIAQFKKDSTLAEGKPALVPLVQNEQNLAGISKFDFFKFIESSPTEPFIASMEIIRLGMVNTGETVVPFVILSVPDPQIASKEFLIAEKSLLQLFYRALDIDISNHIAEVGKEFVGTYLYNLPVRVLYKGEGTGEVVLLYGYATNNILVVTTKPEVLRAVYDTIIRQL